MVAVESATFFSRRAISGSGGRAGTCASTAVVKTNARIVRMRWSLPLLFIMTLASGQSLDVRVHSALAGFQGTVSIFAKNLDSGATFGLRADERIRTASTIKLAILAAAFQAVEEGKIKWSDVSTLHEEDKVH